jgi:hypothetical protein
MKVSDITLGSISGLLQKAYTDEDVTGLRLATSALLLICDYLASYKGEIEFEAKTREIVPKLFVSLEKEDGAEYSKLLDEYYKTVGSLTGKYGKYQQIQPGGWIKNVNGWNPFEDSTSIEFKLVNGEEDYGNSDDVDWSLSIGDEAITYYREC